MLLSEIKNLCSLYGIKPSKAKGQNFLIDELVLEEIISAAQLQKQDNVVEIGPGFGILTQELIKHCQQVLSIELDKGLGFFLQKNLRHIPNFKLLQADVLKIKNEEIVNSFSDNREKYKIVANLPYSISKAVLRKFLTYDPKPTEMVILLQKEVAQKIIASAGQMNILALSVQFYGRPKLVKIISQQSFYPQPAVASALVRIKIPPNYWQNQVEMVLGQENLLNFSEKKFWQLIKIGFSSPRKQLHNNINAGLKIEHQQLKKILLDLGLREDCRAQDLNLKNWLILYQQLMVEL